MLYFLSKTLLINVFAGFQMMNVFNDNDLAVVKQIIIVVNKIRVNNLNKQYLR